MENRQTGKFKIFPNLDSCPTTHLTTGKSATLTFEFEVEIWMKQMKRHSTTLKIQHYSNKKFADYNKHSSLILYIDM